MKPGVDYVPPLDLMKFDAHWRITEYDWIPEFQDYGHLDIRGRFLPNDLIRQLTETIRLWEWPSNQ